MIGCFPDPYPDEVLYSVCARLQERMQYPSMRNFNFKLFGIRNAVATIALPCHLKHLTANLPPSHRYSVDQFINNNTLLPFYSPFLPLERAKLIRKDMHSHSGSRVYQLASITSSSVSMPSRLRFCPSCVEVDRAEFGETYWHRLHQVTGVEVCPDHSVYLEGSGVRVHNLSSSGEYITAEHTIKRNISQPLACLKLKYQILLKIAHDISWLLNQQALIISYQWLHQHYRSLLADCGLASPSGRVFGTKILKALVDYYSYDLLHLLQCDYDGQAFNKWPLILVKDLNINKVHHPLRHLLLIHLMGFSAEEFFSNLLSHKLIAQVALGGNTSFIGQNIGANRPRNPPPRKPQLRNVRRVQWLQILQENPQALRTALRKQYKGIYSWLECHDLEWLKAHLPPPAPPMNRRIIDWGNRDVHIAEEVRQSALRLRTAPGKPKRITQNLVSKDINRRTMLHRQLRLLPLTAKALEEIAETRVEFAKRRMRWAADCFRKEGVVPAWSTLVLRATVGSDMWHESEVKAVIDSELQALQRLRGTDCTVAA